ncbi:hypothetical protein ACFFRR_005386 [Megaselia abdita]
MKTDLEPMQAQLETLINDNNTTKSSIASLQSKLQNFEQTLYLQNRKMETLEKKQRCKNLVFINVEKNTNTEKILSICRDIIKASMDKIVVCSTQILNVRNELATVLVTFQDEKSILLLMGSKIRVDYDYLSPQLRAKRSVLMALKKEILSKNSTTKTFLQQD